MNSYDYPYTPLYYSTPIQVKYCDGMLLVDGDEIPNYSIGIAYKDELIKKDGSVVLIEDVMNEYMNIFHFDDIIIELEWKELN